LGSFASNPRCLRHVGCPFSCRRDIAVRRKSRSANK
jgi:hypothetical protein